jgi:hypothetical protein
VLAQVSIEFIVLVSVLILVLLTVIYYNSSFYLQINSAKNYNDAQTISDQISSEINLALQVGSGYSRSFYVPEKISNSIDYNVTVSNYATVLGWNGGYVTSTILAENISGNLIKGQNTIKNLNGTIYVNQ